MLAYKLYLFYNFLYGPGIVRYLSMKIGKQLCQIKCAPLCFPQIGFFFECGDHCISMFRRIIHIETIYNTTVTKIIHCIECTPNVLPKYDVRQKVHHFSCNRSQFWAIVYDMMGACYVNISWVLGLNMFVLCSTITVNTTLYENRVKWVKLHGDVIFANMSDKMCTTFFFGFLM